MNITVTRAFLIGGAVQEVGKSLDLPVRMARELFATGKAVPAEELPAQSGPMTTETVPVLMKGKKGKHAE